VLSSRETFAISCLRSGPIVKMLGPSVLVMTVLFSLSRAVGFAQEQSGADGLVSARDGALPIILSAPHGGRRPVPDVGERQGMGVAQFSTGRDHYTDELTETIAVKLDRILGARPFSVVAQFERKYLDPNRPPESAYESSAAQYYYEAYHRALREACRSVRGRWGRGLLLDIHGQGSELETIFRGTYNGRTVSSLLERFGRDALTGSRSIFGYLEQKGYRVSPAGSSIGHESRYVGGFIVQTYGNHRVTGMDAVQMEFGASLRSRKNLQRMATDMAEAIAVFAQEYLLARKTQLELQPLSSP
jgi:N-formylglutamate amidohydrolase